MLNYVNNPVDAVTGKNFTQINCPNEYAQLLFEILGRASMDDTKLEKICSHLYQALRQSGFEHAELPYFTIELDHLKGLVK